MAPVLPSHQLETATKSSSPSGSQLVKRKGPVPTRSFGIFHHSSPPSVIAFWSTSQPPERASSASQYPAGAERWAMRVYGSGAESASLVVFVTAPALATAS